MTDVEWSELRILTWVLANGTELTGNQAERYDALVRRSTHHVKTMHSA
jgi:hypothetical protein